MICLPLPPSMLGLQACMTADCARLVPASCKKRQLPLERKPWWSGARSQTRSKKLHSSRTHSFLPGHSCGNPVTRLPQPPLVSARSSAWLRPAPPAAPHSLSSSSSGGGPCLQTATEVLTQLINPPPTAPVLSHPHKSQPSTWDLASTQVTGKK